MPFPPASPVSRPAEVGSLHGLQGLVFLAVEDSRLACEALRLMCHRSGARLRRAEGLAAARAHLSVYRPDVVLVDLGLPDGRGETLIRALTTPAKPGPQPLVIAMSGDASARDAALAAGAVAFLEKPLPGLAAFQAEILALLPDGGARAPIAAAPPADPDPLALRDDLARAAAALAAGVDADERAYLSGFLAGIARQTVDAPLGAASAQLREPGTATEGMARLIRDRLLASEPLGLHV
ncbi:response regulator [Tabrizicola sp. BL-A-41-H6]|uniref:response regulator n=1 Tax=Tabrizicola sp. BL-A-41-H6 TaxID=3421107 RepID=UPI003D67BD32